MDSLGLRIERVQLDKGLTNREFSRILGVRENLMSGYKYDVKMPPLRTIIKICKEFDVDANWLLLGETRWYAR